jgi:Ran GTPase-activating protein (RanGAP) involved in mRNA processing and transport
MAAVLGCIAVSPWQIPPLCSAIDLSFSAIGPEGAHRLAEAMIGAAGANTSALRVVPLTGLNLTWTAIGIEGLGHVIRGLAAVGNLSVLDLKGNWLGDDGGGLLAAAFAAGSFPRLTELHLRWNLLSERGAASLARALTQLPLLRVLDLGGNWLGDAGVASIASSAAELSHLSELRLDTNHLSVSPARSSAKQWGGGAAPTSLAGQHGCGSSSAALRHLLGSSLSLRSLDLSSNQIDEPAVRCIAGGLRANRNLQSLDLSFNGRLGDAAAIALAGALGGHPTIAHVALRGFTVGSAGADSLLDAFRGSQAWSRLELEPLKLRFSGANATQPRVGADRLVRLRDLNDSRRPATRDAGTAQAGNDSAAQQRSEEEAYWRQVYPVAAERYRASPLPPRVTGPPNFFYVSAPSTLLEGGCESHSWAKCRLDYYFERGEVPPRIPHGSAFSPFRMAPGGCMRNMYRWGLADVAEWRRTYPYSSGVADNAWVEVSHTREQTGGAWLYLSAGSGIFWNCGRSLRARNKVDAALLLLQQLHKTSRDQALRRLAAGIEKDDGAWCEADHCRTFMSILRSNRTNRNDNCYGRCRLSERPLHEWLRVAVSGSASTEWWFDHMTASSVFDLGLLRLAKRLKYHSLQLTMQPQVWCGLAWTTEILDLRVRRHRILDILPHLSLRDPSELSRGRPCVVRADNRSRKAFMACVYCEGSLMERVARCLADVSGFKPGFTIYSKYPRHRFEECLSGTRRASS